MIIDSEFKINIFYDDFRKALMQPDKLRTCEMFENIENNLKQLLNIPNILQTVEKKLRNSKQRSTVRVYFLLDCEKQKNVIK